MGQSLRSLVLPRAAFWQVTSLLRSIGLKGAPAERLQTSQATKPLSSVISPPTTDWMCRRMDKTAASSL
jgi:hypothetical protein